MSTFLNQFGEYLRKQVASESQRIEPVPAAPDAPEPSGIAERLNQVADCLSTERTEAMYDYARSLGHELGEAEAQRGATLEQSMQQNEAIWEQVRMHLNGFVATFEQWNVNDIHDIENVFSVYRNAFVQQFFANYQQVQQDLVRQAEQLEAQRYTIRELSTPILPLYEGIIALPLVGSVDSYRAAQVMENLLQAITEQQADIVIIDITGVPVVDTGVANYLLQTARAAQLVGTQIVLVGIGAEIAQTMVQLGVDLSNIMVYANLQAGIQYALGRLGYKIV